MKRQDMMQQLQNLNHEKSIGLKTQSIASSLKRVEHQTQSKSISTKFKEWWIQKVFTKLGGFSWLTV